MAMVSPDHKKGLREDPTSLVNKMPEKIKETFREHGFKGLLPATHIQIWVASATTPRPACPLRAEDKTVDASLAGQVGT